MTPRALTAVEETAKRADVANWLRRLKRLVASKPDDLAVIVTASRVSVIVKTPDGEYRHEEGWQKGMVRDERMILHIAAPAWDEGDP